MPAKTRIGQLVVSSSLGPEINGRSVVKPTVVVPILHMSPRSPLDIDCVSDHTKGVPKMPIKKVSFSTCTQHTDSTTAETILTSRDPDVEDRDYDDLDYSENDNCNDDDRNGDCLTTSSPPSVTETPAMDTETQSSTNVRRRKIRWSGQVRVQEIRHINNISELEKDAVWMSAIDYKMIKNVAKTTVLMMMAGQEIDEDDEDFCKRGLEFRTRKGSKVRSANKLRARSAVLNEQDLQQEEGFHDPEFIAMASLDVSFDNKEQALKRGKKDAKSILLSYMNDVQPQKVKVVLC